MLLTRPAATGGQLIYYDGRVATGVETRDGGSPANQYFAPAGCGVDGSIFFMPAYVPRGSWSSTKAKLVDVPEPTGNCPSPATAFTQWRIELASMYFLLSGVPTWQPVWTIISEHYAGPSIAESTSMERFYFAYGYGWIRWEAWTTNTATPQDTDLLGRCPVCISTAARGRLLSQPRIGARLRAGRGPTSFMTAMGRRQSAVSDGRRD